MPGWRSACADVPDTDTGAARRHRRPSAAVGAELALVGAGLVLVGWTGPPTTDPVRASGHHVRPAPPSPPAEVRAAWRPGAPRLLRIPSLRVNAPVVPVLARGHTLVPPRDAGTLGWWAEGTRPGERRGSILIAGHTLRGGGQGALQRLGDLRPGAVVVVVTDEASLAYVVREVHVLGRSSLAARARRLFGREGRSRLVLVTCAGWDGAAFESNVVAIARPARVVE